jgi:hypothetical protein
VKGKSVPQVWRDAVRDSSLDSTAKGVAYALTTWMNLQGHAFPGRAALAAGAGYTVRTIDRAVPRLEKAGLLRVVRNGGRSKANYYIALLPERATESRRSEWERATLTTEKGDSEARNSDRVSPESGKESGYESVGVDSSVTDPPATVPLDYCGRCDEKRPLPDWIYCEECLQVLREGVEGE